MPISIREQLLAAITLAVGGEYDSDIPSDERELPITLVSNDVESATSNYDSTVIEIPVAVARVAVSTGRTGDAQRTQANALLSEIITEMGADETFGGLSTSAEYQGGDAVALDNKFVAAEAQFTVTFEHLRGDPYTN